MGKREWHLKSGKWHIKKDNKECNVLSAGVVFKFLLHLYNLNEMNLPGTVTIKRTLSTKIPRRRLKQAVFSSRNEIEYLKLNAH